MTPLMRFILSRHKHQCDLCGVAMALALIALGLIGALHLGADR